MKYMGSKARIAKEILPIMLKDRYDGQYYVEPFAGGMNTISEVSGNRIANDKNDYLIAMWDALTKGVEFDKQINKDLYDEARNRANGKEANTFCVNCNLPTDGGPCSYKRCPIFPYMTKAEIGWIGWMGSANGRFFDGGYSGKSNTKIGTVRDYIKEAISNIEKQLPKMVGVQFQNKDYTELEIPSGCIIYCDIPYQGTKQYSTSKHFNYDFFYLWCRLMRNMGHTVFVSEYNMPNDFTCVWEKEVKSSLSANGVIGGNKTSVERLWVLL